MFCGKENRVFLKQWKNLWSLKTSGCNFVLSFTFLYLTDTSFIHALEDYNPIHPSEYGPPLSMFLCPSHTAISLQASTKL